jgi:DNA-binding NarL/FixJ family response regulator
MDGRTGYGDHRPVLKRGASRAEEVRVSKTHRDLPSSEIRVVIVDDAPVCRAAIRELLEHRGFQVAGEAGGAAAAIELVDQLSPDAILLDVHLPDGDGFGLAAQLSERHPELAILLTSADSQDTFHALAEQSGARGFVPKHRLTHAQFERFWPRVAQT